MAIKIQIRRDTAANWTSVNPTLSHGEPGLETDTGKIKYGTGSTAWTSLGYSVDVGPTGVQGATGTQGTTGIGSQGTTGSQGTVGIQGTTGTTGTTGSQGTTGTTGSQGTTGATSPRINSVAYPGNDTATNPAGGDIITLTGSNFAAGAIVVVNGIAAGVVSVISSSTITFTAPANPTGNYILYVVDPNGATAIAVPGLQYSGTPTWATAAGSLGNAIKNNNFTTTISASGDAPITYSVYSGTLPSGITLNSTTGVISGTAPDVSVDTTYSFTIRASDAQNQDTDRSFNIVVIALAIGQQAYTSGGTYTWVAPVGVTSVCVVCVGGGGGGASGTSGGTGGAGGGLGWKNNIAVVPGQSYAVFVATDAQNKSDILYSWQTPTAGENSYFIDVNTVMGGGGGPGVYASGTTVAIGGSYTGHGGGRGGNSGYVYNGGAGGGGGAGGYTGNGGGGGNGQNPSYNVAGQGRGYDGTGGGGGGDGGSRYNFGTRGGGGVGLLGQGANGVGGNGGYPNYSGENGGTGGSGGGSGGFQGGIYGGGGAGGATSGSASGYGGHGAVRIIWGPGRSFPTTNTSNM